MLTFLLNEMTLRKITIDNRVGYNPQSERTKESDIKSNTLLAGSLPRKQNKNFSQNFKKFFIYLAGEGFGIFK